MKKVNLLVKGDVISNIMSIQPSTGGGSNVDLICKANPEDYDLTSAIIIEGNLDIDSITVRGIVAITGRFVTKRVGG